MGLGVAGYDEQASLFQLIPLESESRVVRGAATHLNSGSLIYRTANVHLQHVQSLLYLTASPLNVRFATRATRPLERT